MTDLDDKIAAAKAALAILRKKRRYEWRREYLQRPEVQAKQREYAQRPEVQARRREYFRRPEVKLRAKLRAAGLHKVQIDAEIARAFPVLAEAAE